MSYERITSNVYLAANACETTTENHFDYIAELFPKTRWTPLRRDHDECPDGYSRMILSTISEIPPTSIFIHSNDDEYFYVKANSDDYFKCDQIRGLKECLTTEGFLKATSADFMNAWIECVAERREILLEKWQNAPVFTSLIKSNNDSVLKHVGDKLGLKCYANDYYFLDGILYDSSDLVPGIPENQYWFRQIRVAFEHENYFKSGLYKEVAHLLLINSDLKVLVTYPDHEMKEAPTAREMKYLHEIIRGNHDQKRLSDSESFLIIFGSEGNFGWEGYVYKEDGWKCIRENVK